MKVYCKSIIVNTLLGILLAASPTVRRILE